MKTIYLMIVIICFSNIYQVSAQNTYTFSQFTDETFDLLKQPTKWDGDDYLKIGIFSTLSVLMMTYADEPIHDLILDHDKYYNSAPMETGRYYGEVYVPVILFGGFEIYSLITKDKTAKKIAFEIAQAAIYNGVINYFLKVTIGRARPYLNLGPGTFQPFNSLVDQDFHSFPGGHASSAFTLSTVIARNVKPVWLKALIYVPAILTLSSRIYQNMHWTSDCLIGAAFGYSMGTWVVDQHDKKAKIGSEETSQSLIDRINFRPVIIEDSYGVNISISLY